MDFMAKGIEKLFHAVLGTYFPWILLVCTFLATAGLVSDGALFWESLLKAAVFFMGGIQGLWAAIAHLGFPVTTARLIGWEPSPFQTEMGATNLALGVTGVLSWLNPTWLIPVGLIVAIVFAGCALTHIQDRITNKNTAPCNSGPMLYSTLFTSLMLFVAIWKATH